MGYSMQIALGIGNSLILMKSGYFIGCLTNETIVHFDSEAVVGALKLLKYFENDLAGTSRF